MLSACADLKESGKKIGEGTKEAATAIGHATKNVAKSVQEEVK